MKISKKTWFFLTLCLLIVSINLFSPYKIELLGHYQKILAHRVNSLEKLKYSQKHFNGAELDLVFHEETQTFDVNHPPAKSIHLTLEDYLSNVTKKTFFLWLDIKNLTPENSKKAHAKIQYLISKYQLSKDQFLIESTIAKSLNIFVINGYNCSFYITEDLNTLTKTALKNKIVTIKKELLLQPQIGLSSDLKNYLFLHEYFPTTSKYHWALNRFLIPNILTLQKSLRDSSVKLLLVQYKTPKGNR